MQTVSVQIDITSPTGRRLLQEVQRHPKVAKVEYPLIDSEVEEKTYTVKEVFDECIDVLSKHYNVDGQKIWKDLK